jgi:uncharacterized protein (TIGR02145 family)
VYKRLIDGETRVENLPDHNPLTDNLYVVANSSGDLHRVSILDLAAQIKLINEYPTGTVFCTPVPTAIVDVVNPTTGKTWMDRNLGASQVATSSTDANAYGDLYQWGRFADGHQCRSSNTTSINATVDSPNHGDFILEGNFPFDWRVPQNTNLWQGVNGVNNPCPKGYRIPTNAELDTERASWGADNATSAFNSPLRFTAGGYRHGGFNTIYNLGSRGYYWASTVDGVYSRLLSMSTGAGMGTVDRKSGHSIRCIKE